MTAVLDLALETATPAQDTRVSGDERRCLVSGEMKSKSQLIRFVIGPDQTVFPDLAEKLPGHGLWVTASHEAVAAAAKKNLFAKAAKEPAKPAPDLADQTAQLLRARCLSLLGLAKSAGNAVLGEAQTEAASRANKLALLLRANDAARALDNRYAVPECAFFSRDEMGAALGYEQIVYVGLMPHGLTTKVKREIARLNMMQETGKNE
ncbi:MAG: DUF448 domain-containing protein [Alphaproteobacteria bacterium]|nr:DUF448 domain-containing protein [Alphaproteobacteria bacterium]